MVAVGHRYLYNSRDIRCFYLNNPSLKIPKTNLHFSLFILNCLFKESRVKWVYKLYIKNCNNAINYSCHEHSYFSSLQPLKWQLSFRTLSKLIRLNSFLPRKRKGWASLKVNRHHPGGRGPIPLASEWLTSTQKTDRTPPENGLCTCYTIALGEKKAFIWHFYFGLKKRKTGFKKKKKPSFDILQNVTVTW